MPADIAALDPDTELRLSVSELGDIYEAVHPQDGDPETAMEAGYHVGQCDAAVAFHRILMDTAEIHTPDTE